VINRGAPLAHSLGEIAGLLEDGRAEKAAVNGLPARAVAAQGREGGWAGQPPCASTQMRGLTLRAASAAAAIRQVAREVTGPGAVMPRWTMTASAPDWARAWAWRGG
jgi:hypothetical protein